MTHDLYQMPWRATSPILRPGLVATLVCALTIGGLLFGGAGNGLADESAPVAEEPELTDLDRDHWSFKPLSRPQVPDVEQRAWCRNPIDRFILARIEAAELEPLPPADSYTLLRRVTYDLTGLPPTPDEIREFVSDDHPLAYERVVDRLLASPAYGERWAQHWLDLARFAETDGFEHDKVRPNAWRYRDWVIQALNADLPYDEFVRYQLAGDEIAPGSPSAAVATGFLLCGPDMPDINLQTERRHMFLNDMTATVGSVFLGLQFGCAQCHNHKFDPISQRDFYRFRAFFESAELFRERPIPTAAERMAREAFESQRAARWKALQQSLDAILQAQREQRPTEPAGSAEQILQSAPQDVQDEYERLHAELERVKAQKPPELPLGRVVSETTTEPAESYLWVRGSFRRRGPEVHAAFPRIANPDSIPVTPTPGDQSTGLRSALAEWLVQPTHPLTTRVIVNRIWQHHFGRGLSTSPSDFGIMGDWPTHPELLDWLATELPARNWSLKSLHRLIVTSAVYRQASRPSSESWSMQMRERVRKNWMAARQSDPDNDLLVGMRLQRLEGEAIRDAMLASSGTLSQRRGGPGVRPPLPDELVSTLLKNQWPVTPNAKDHFRRSIYLFVRRNLRYPIFDVFDRPDTNASCPRRNESTIAPQSLTLLNSAASLASARALAGLLLSAPDATTDAHRVKLAFLRTLGRPPRQQELDDALAFLKQTAEVLRASQREPDELATPQPMPVERDTCVAAAWTDLCLALMNLNEFLYID